MIVAVNGYTNNHVAKFTFNLKSLFNARSASHVQLRLYNYHIIIYTNCFIPDISMGKI